MFDIKCKRQGCVYNKNCNCTSKDIEVNKKAECKTYKPSNEAEVGEVEKIDQPAIRKDISVSCKADCLFNNEDICIANGITVQTCSNASCPNCCTFKRN